MGELGVVVDADYNGAVSVGNDVSGPGAAAGLYISLSDGDVPDNYLETNVAVGKPA